MKKILTFLLAALELTTACGQDSSEIYLLANHKKPPLRVIPIFKVG